MLKKVNRVHFRNSWLLGTVSPHRLRKTSRSHVPPCDTEWSVCSGRVFFSWCHVSANLSVLWYGGRNWRKWGALAWLTLKAFKENRKSRRVYLFALSDHEIMLGHIWTATFFHAICCFSILSAVERTCPTVSPSAGGMWDSKAADDIWNNLVFVLA